MENAKAKLVKITKALLFALLLLTTLAAANAELWYNSTSSQIGSAVVSRYSFSRQLDSPGKYYCQGKTADKTGEVTALFPSFTYSFNTSQYQVRIGIKEGTSSAPNGSWIAYADLNSSNTIYGGAGYNVTYSDGTGLVAGNLYYYCAVCYNCNSTDYVNLDAFYMTIPSEIETSSCTMFQSNGVCDNNLKLFYYGTDFSSPASELVNIPYLAMTASEEYDGIVNLNSQYYRHANNQSVIAEKFRLKSYETSLNVTNATIYMRPQGSPGLPVVELRNYSDNTILATAQCPNITTEAWWTCDFTSSVVIDNSSYYYLVVKCPEGCSDDFTNTIQVMHYENTFYDEITPYDPTNTIDQYLYDTVNSYFISSDDNLTSETHAYQHVDMAFYLTGNPTNQKPTVVNVTVNPFPYYTTYNLTCNYTASDPEGQTLTPTYEWYLNGTAQNINSSILHYKNTTARDSWSCSVQVFDGEITSSIKYSGNVTIVDNVPPVASNLASDKSHYLSTETALISVHCSDAESPVSQVVYSVSKPGGIYENETMVFLSGDTYFDELALVAGTYTIDRTYCTDSAGNTGVLNDTLSFSVSNPAVTQNGGGGGVTQTTEYVQNPFCGDGICSVDENPSSCPEDCRIDFNRLVTCLFKDDASCVYNDAWFAQIVLLFLVFAAAYIAYKNSKKVRK